MNSTQDGKTRIGLIDDAIVVRRQQTISLNRSQLSFKDRPLVMGILNVTPDSFSDGGLFVDTERAVDHALQLVTDGADILDVGGESTRPGSSPVSLAEELRRIEPILSKLRQAVSVPISLDTYKAEVADVALQIGVDIINDVGSLQFDPEMSSTIARHDAGCVIVHSGGKVPASKQRVFSGDVMEAIIQDLSINMKRAVTARG